MPERRAASQSRHRVLRGAPVPGIVIAILVLLLVSLFVGVPETGAATLVLTPFADGYVDSQVPDSSFGSASRLKVSTSTTGRTQNIHLTFQVSGVGPVSGAVLRLFANDASDTGGVLFTVPDTSWTEAGLTWNGRPAPGVQVAQTGAVTKSRWLEIDVSSVVTGPGMYGFTLEQGSADAAAFHARQGSKPPILVIDHAPLPTAEETPTETPVETPMHTPTTPPGGQPNRVTCEGYPEPRTFLEAQDWWQPIPGIEPSTQGHVHLGMCFPLGQTVSGHVEFDVRITLHANLGVVARIKLQDDKSKTRLLAPLGISAPPSGELVHWEHAVIDTTAMLDGVRLFRWYVDLIHSNGNRQTARTGWPLLVDNGLADANVKNPTLVKFSGWYQEGDGTEWGYTNGDIGPVPTAPVSGTWTTKLQISNTAGPGVTGYRVALDPDFHAGDPGTTIASGIGAFKGDLVVDTSGMSPGRHRLVVITTSSVGDEEHSGVAVVPFTVAAP